MCPVSANERENSVNVSINLDFYPRPQVLLAAQEFSSSCWVNVNDLGSGRMQVSIRPKSPADDASVAGYAFFNYLLSLVKAR